MSAQGIRVFFGALLILGLVVARDYGISWDEKAMHVLGEEAFGFIFHGRAYPTNVGIRFHGAWFEIIQYAVEMLLHLRYARHVYILRHAMGFLFYWAGLVALYGIAVRTFRHRGWALLTVLFFFLSPRLFGHSFVNTRDIPAMVCFVIKMLTLMLFLDRPTYGRAVLHGIASGLIMSLRVGGLFVPIYVSIFFALLVLREAHEDGHVDWMRHLKVLAVYGIVFALSTIAFWPLLWHQPLTHFYDAMLNMMTAQQSPGGFYLGEMVGEIPWHWIPVNILTKTPLLYSVLFLIGAGELAVVTVKRPWSLARERRDTLLFFLWFMVPILIVIVMRGRLFDEWRHLYFIYPGMLLLAVHGLQTIWNMLGRTASRTLREALRTGLVALCIASAGSSALWMVRNHPLEYMYFSIPPEWVEGYFALDYWGLSYRQGFEWILAHDSGSLISVHVTSSPGWENLNILTQEQRKRLVVLNNRETKYVLDNFHDSHYAPALPAKDKLASITLEGIDVLGIYRNPAWKPDMDRDLRPMEDFEVQERFDANDIP